MMHLYDMVSFVCGCYCRNRIQIERTKYSTNVRNVFEYVLNISQKTIINFLEIQRLCIKADCTHFIHYILKMKKSFYVYKERSVTQSDTHFELKLGHTNISHLTIKTKNVVCRIINTDNKIDDRNFFTFISTIMQKLKLFTVLT